MSDLDRLFYWRGIAPDFYNFKGELESVSLDKRVQILKAMGVNTSTPKAIAREVFDLDIKPWLEWLSELEVIPESNPKLEINFKPEEVNQQFSWSILRDDSEIDHGKFTPSQLPEVGNYIHQDRRYSRRELDIGSPVAGYYEICLQLKTERVITNLAITPDSAYQPNWADLPESNLWGFVVQLYTLRSDKNWGIGDFSDLLSLVSNSAKYGADIIGLNPFHALQSDLKNSYSPYAPSDRRFLNPLYIDVEAAPGYKREFKPAREIESARAATHVDYDLIRSIKYAALFRCFERFLSQPDDKFVDYVTRHGNQLIMFAEYEALTNWRHKEFDQRDHETVDLQHILTVVEISTNAPVEHQLVAFYCYLQWVAESQLVQCQRLAESLDMKVGLVRDLAVGASGDGAEAITSARLFCREASIGAPPDPFSHIGQNWGMPPMDPAELRRTGFAHFISLLRANMAHCGALRIDHAMSLYRLWWCPSDETADEGAYVYYPFREMLGLLCLESHLNKCIVVAEDLGVVPDEFRLAMSDKSLYANRLFYFEKWSDEEFKHPSQYDRLALTMLDNHDVPTLIAWWNASDLKLRNQLGLFESDDEFESQKNIRVLEKQNLIEHLKEDDQLPDNWQERSLESEIDYSLMSAIVLYVGMTNSQFYLMQLEDLLMMSEPVNVPSTYLEHKNWSRKLTKNIEDIFVDPKVHLLLKQIASMRSALREGDK